MILVWVAVGVLALVYLLLCEGAYFGTWFVRGVYNRLAPVWSYPTRPRMQAQDREELLPLIRAALDGGCDGRVLDVATGTGRVPLLLLDSVWFTGRIAGIDVSTGMLERARANLSSSSGAQRVELVEGRAEHLPWAGGEFDVVTCIEAFHNFGRPRAALAEMCRVLRPGGTLIVTKPGDGFARLMPGKALTRRGFRRRFAALGMRLDSTVRYRGGSPRTELVVAVKF